MGEDNIITIPCTLDRYNRKKDRSVTLAFTSLLEISNEEFSVIDTFHQQSGHLLFRRNSFTNEDIPTEDVETDIAKSQATQVRDALWVLYRARGYKAEDKESWNLFYRRQMQLFKARILEEVRLIEESR
jgi:hypothetical protein